LPREAMCGLELCDPNAQVIAEIAMPATAAINAKASRPLTKPMNASPPGSLDGSGCGMETSANTMAVEYANIAEPFHRPRVSAPFVTATGASGRNSAHTESGHRRVACHRT